MLKARSIVCGLLALAIPALNLAVFPLPAPADTPAAYNTYISGATAQRGLFTIWHKGDDVGIELQANQLGVDFVETATPVNGIGQDIFSGMTDLQPVRAIRFVRSGDKVAILFPSTRFYAQPGTPQAASVQAATSPTVVGIAKVLAENTATGAVIIDASPFLRDITDVADALTGINSDAGPAGAYRLDTSQSYIGQTKSFPENSIITVAQTFSTGKVGNAPALTVAPDARNLQIQLQYNIAQMPNDGYVPRLYDDRIGYFVNAHDDFTHDTSYSKDLNYIIRWNLQPSDPSKAISPAKKPIIYYLSDTIPYRYRDPIRRAILKWNGAFERIGISNAVEVLDQPNDPNFDPDDIRYNVIRWLSEVDGGFAEAQFLYNPYTGEMIKAGVVIDSDIMRDVNFEYPVSVAPTSTGIAKSLGNGSGDDDYDSNERFNFGFGKVVMELQGYPVPEKYADEYVESLVLHESGHDFGLRHNFMGPSAYTAQQDRSKAFTSKYGVSTSVMAYSPINIWPKNLPSTGDYFQTVLGPYDYYAIRYGYGRIPGASTPQEEKPTLNRWAGAGANPIYHFSSDEDVSWPDGAAIDPRNQQWDLTNDNIGWCGTQMELSREILRNVDRRFPRDQAPYDDLREAFNYGVGYYTRCSQIVSRYIGGEYLSRTLRGDPGATMPLSPIPIATQKRAFAVLKNGTFSAATWDFSPALLRQLVTQYRGDDWLGNTPTRHDISIESLAATSQSITISRLFAPVMLQRLDDMDLKYKPGTTMDLGDLFSWMQDAVFGSAGSNGAGDIASGKAIPLVRRNLQRLYEDKLATIATAQSTAVVSYDQGGNATSSIPPDAQALARYELQNLRHSIAIALNRGVPDLVTRAHLEALDAEAHHALNPRGS